MGGIMLGEREYARQLLSGRKVGEEHPTPVRRLRERARWIDLVRAAEKIKGGKWNRWAERHGDWSRNALMYLATRHGGLRLAEVVREAGIQYQAAAQAVKRFGQALPEAPKRKRLLADLTLHISTV